MILPRKDQSAPACRHGDEWSSLLALQEHLCYPFSVRAGDEPAFGGLRPSKEHLAQPTVGRVAGSNPFRRKAVAVIAHASSIWGLRLPVVPADTRQVARSQTEKPLASAMGSVTG
jgi:hypothetical protein